MDAAADVAPKRHVQLYVMDARTAHQAANHANVPSVPKMDATVLVAHHQQLNQVRHAAAQPDAVRTNHTVLITIIGKSASKLSWNSVNFPFVI